MLEKRHLWIFQVRYIYYRLSTQLLFETCKTTNYPPLHFACSQLLSVLGHVDRCLQDLATWFDEAHEKVDNTQCKNYDSISLLPIPLKLLIPEFFGSKSKEDCYENDVYKNLNRLEQNSNIQGLQAVRNYFYHKSIYLGSTLSDLRMS